MSGGSRTRLALDAWDFRSSNQSWMIGASKEKSRRSLVYVCLEISELSMKRVNAASSLFALKEVCHSSPRIFRSIHRILSVVAIVAVQVFER